MTKRLSSPHHRIGKTKQPSKITVPTRACAHVRLVFSEMFRQNISYDEVEDGSGVLRATLKAWRTANYPGLSSMEAVLGFLGYDFIPIPRENVLPPDVVAELRPIADRLGIEMKAAIHALAEIAIRDHHLHSLRPPQVESQIHAQG